MGGGRCADGADWRCIRPVRRNPAEGRRLLISSGPACSACCTPRSLPALRLLLVLAALSGLVLALQATQQMILAGLGVMGAGLVPFGTRRGAWRAPAGLRGALELEE